MLASGEDGHTVDRHNRSDRGDAVQWYQILVASLMPEVQRTKQVIHHVTRATIASPAAHLYASNWTTTAHSVFATADVENMKYRVSGMRSTEPSNFGIEGN